MKKQFSHEGTEITEGTDKDFGGRYKADKKYSLAKPLPGQKAPRTRRTQRKTIKGASCCG